MTETSYPIAGGAGVIEYTYETLMANAMSIGVVESFSDATANSAANAGLVYGDSTGRKVKVAAGWSYMLRGFKWDAGSDVTVLALAANTSGKSRIDRVVLRLDRSTYTVRLAVLQGTPGDAPAAPAVTQSTSTTGIYEVPLAQVTITSNSGTGLPSIAAGDVRTEYKYLMPRGSLGLSTWRSGSTQLGRFYQEWDTGRLFLGTPGGDILVGENGPWTKLAVASGWMNDNIYAQRVNGLTYFQCYVRLNSADRAPGTDITVCVLPATFWPLHNLYAPAVMTPGQSGFAYFDAATGAVKITAYPQTFPNQGIVAIGPVAYPSVGVKS